MKTVLAFLTSVLLFSECTAQPQRPRRKWNPTHTDVAYGPHERNLMDVWLAKSATPTPVLVSIHGGGFFRGKRNVDPRLLRECLESGISVVAITYRFSQDAIAPAPFTDSARAIQFIRHNAKEWNIDPTRIAGTGSSAGAGISLWLGFHDDMADPGNPDPVLQESTRLSCMAVYNGQSSYDPRFIRELFPGTDTWRHRALSQLFGIDIDQIDELPDEKYRLFEEVSALHHLSNDDPPAMMMFPNQMDTAITSQSIGIHHPRFGKALREKMDPLGIECQIETGIARSDPRYVQMTLAFIRRSFSPPIIVEEALTYGQAGDTELKLDLARPDGDGPFPAIVFIHGGGWYQGQRDDYRPQIEEAARRGYVAVTISYRLMKFDEANRESTTAEPIFPAQIHDVKAAVRWLRANAETYRIDPERIGATGASAGGHLSLMLGLTDADSGLEGDNGSGDQSSRVQAVVNVFGPTELVDCQQTSILAWIFPLFLGGTPEAAAETYRAASPVTWVSDDDPPVLTVHGDSDLMVPIAQAKRLDAAMKAAGASHTLNVLPGQRHLLNNEGQRQLMDATWEFFDRHLQPNSQK